MNDIINRLGIKPIEWYLSNGKSSCLETEVREVEQQKNKSIIEISNVLSCGFYPDGEKVEESGKVFLFYLLGQLTGIEPEKIKEMIK